MKKLTLFCLESDRDATLERLRRLGVLHVEPVQVREDDEVEQTRRNWEHVRRVLKILPRHAQQPPSGKPATEVIETVWMMVRRRREIDEELRTRRHERLRIEPFGDFDPAALRALAERGIYIRLFRADPRHPAVIPEGYVARELCRTREAVCLAVVGRGQDELSGAKEVRLPKRSLGELNKRISGLESEREELTGRLHRFSGDYAVVAELKDEAEARYRLAEVRAGMGEVSRVAYLSGYLPARDEARIRAAARELGWGFRITAPGPEDQPPTLIENPTWVRPIRAVFEMTGLVPGYDEVDIGMPFLVFLSIYFAMLVGDAGYGLLFILLTALARRKFRAAPVYPFRLLYIMSGATVVWGALTGTWFGLPREGFLLVPWFNDEQHIKLLCFLLGAVHLSLAHFWRAVRLAPSPKALAQLGWIGSTWVMFLAARFFLLGADFPAWGGLLLAVSVATVLFFSVPRRELRQKGVSLAMLPLDVISNFTDVVSYLRLFAVGTASYAVAASFNQMLSPFFGNVFGALAAALALFAGHTLNILLCGLGVLVHGVRLNTLEFSSHMGMQWTGYRYTPFRRKATAKEE